MAKRERVERLILLNLVEMLGINRHQHITDKCVQQYLTNREERFYLIDPVVKGQVRTALKPFEFALHIATRSSLGSTQCSDVNVKLAFKFCINITVALALFWVAVVQIVNRATARQS